MNLKSQFSIPQDAIYLNCAAQGPLSKAASLAVQQSIKDKEYPAVIDQNYGESLTANAKLEISKLLNCPIENISLANSTSWGINTIVNGYEFKNTDEVILLDGQFPSNSSPWNFLGNKNVRIKKLACKNYFFDLDQFENELTSNTKLVCLEWVHFVSGDRIPLKEIINICHKREIFVVVDATQGLGAIPFSLQEHPVDALICSAYKWLVSPYGSGFMVLSNRMIEKLSPKQVNWLNFKNIQYSGKLADCSYEFCNTARQFDVFSYMGFMNLSGMIASLKFLNSLSLRENYNYVRGLIKALENNLDTDFFTPLNKQADNQRHSLISTFECKNIEMAEIVKKLEESKVTVSLRQGYLRISPYIYNSQEEINQFSDLLNSLSLGISKIRPSTASV